MKYFCESCVRIVDKVEIVLNKDSKPIHWVCNEIIKIDENLDCELKEVFNETKA